MMSKKEIMLANAQRKAKKLTSDDEVPIRCKLCNNQTTDEHLERHIKYNHIISNDEMFYKLYYMHFPHRFPENVKHTDTQTRITWIGEEMDNKEEGQNNISNLSDPIPESSNTHTKITCIVCGKFFEHFQNSTNVVECPSCLESSPHPGSSRDRENTADVEASTKETSPAVSESSININKHCEEEEELKAENLQTAETDNKELSLDTEAIPDLAIDNISVPANEHIAPNKVSENETVKRTDEANELEIVGNNFPSNTLLDPCFETEVKNWSSSDIKILNKKVLRDLSPLCLRYKCPYCEEHNRKVDNIQDHILTHHSKDPNLLTSDGPVPPIKEQTMKIYLPKDSDWIEACLKESCYQLPPEACKVDTLNYNWIDGNPELPKDWKHSTVENQLGVTSMHYLSPCGMVFKSKQKVMDFLIKEGKKAKILFKSKCDGFCEGTCNDFVVPEYFYNENDPNKVRPKTKLKLILDKDVNVEAKVKEKLIKGVPKIPKTLAIAGVRYRLPGNATHKDRKNYLLENTDSESESEDNSFNFNNDELIYSHPIFFELNEINVHNQSAMKEELEQHALEYEEPQKKGRGRPKIKMKEMWSQSPTFIGLPSTSVSELTGTNFKQKEEEKSLHKDKSELDTPIEATDNATTKLESPGTSLIENGKGKDLMDVWETNIGSKYKSRNQSGDLDKSFEDNGAIKIETCNPSEIYAAKKVDITYNHSESDCKDAKVLGTNESAVDEGSDSGRKEKVKRISNSSKSSGGSTKRNSSIDRNSKKRKGSTDSCDKKLNTIKPNRLGLIGFDEVFQSKKSKSKSASPALEESESEEEHGDSTQIEHNEKANEEKEPTTSIESVNLKRYEGIDVQCCKKKCERWHRLTEFKDASDVPQYWICSMNQDKSNNKCVRKKDVKKLAKPEYKLGNMVWVKYEDLPWWPAVVTIDGDSEEYFWIEWEVSKTVPQQYHITYFEDGIEISGIWLPIERIQKMTSTLDAPAKSKMDPEMRRKYKEAINKANVFLELSRQERIDTQLADTKAYDEWNHEDQEKINGVDDIQNNKPKIPKLKLKRKRIETNVEEDTENAHVVKSKRKSSTSNLVDEKLDEFDLETERISKIRKKNKFNEIESEDEELDYIRNIKNSKRKKAVIESDNETNGDETHQIKEKKHSKTNEIKLEQKDNVRIEQIYKSRRNKPKRTNYAETEQIDNVDSEQIFRSKRNRPLKNNHDEQERESNTGNEHTYRSNHEKTLKTDNFEAEKYSEDNEQIYNSKRHKPINNINEKQGSNVDYIQKGKNKTARSNKIEVDSKITSPPKSPLKKMPGKVKSTFNCEHCNANIPYNMQQVDFHVQEHGYTMTGYMAKYDVSDDPNLDTLRRWVNKMKPRNQSSLAASVPVKIKTEKCDDSVETSGEAARSDIPLVKTENSEVSAKENVVGSSSIYVEEYQQRKEREQTQSLPLVKSEELLDSVDESNFQVYPTIPYDVLIALSVRNLDRDNFRGASFNQMIAFVCLHFPYFNRNVEKLKALIKKSYNRVNNESDKLKIQDEHIESLRKRVDSWRIRNKDEVKKFMWIPDFLEIIVERFSDQNHLLTDNPAMKSKPPYSRKMVLYLALISISPPSTTDKIWIFIRFLFPSLEKSVQGFERQDFDNDLLEEENITEIEDNSGQKMYAIREGFLPEVRHNVRNYFSTISNLKQLKKSILKPEFVDLLLPNLGMP